MVDRRSEQSDGRVITYILAGSICLLVALSAVGGILTVGDHLSSVSGVLGVVFYLALAVVVVLGIGYPVFQISRRPVFSLYQLHSGTDRQKAHYRELLVQNMFEMQTVDDQTKNSLEAMLVCGDSQGISRTFKDVCGPVVDEQIKTSAKRAFFASVISRSALVETATMASISLGLVKDIVEVCGFRPTKPSLAKLYTRVMASALIAGGVEDMDLDGLFGEALGGGFGGKASGLILGSAADGLVGAFLVFRIGAITRDYLFAEDAPAEREQVRKESFGQAVDLMKSSGFITEMLDMVKNEAADMAKLATTAVTDKVQGGFSSFMSTVKKAANKGRADSENGEGAFRLPDQNTPTEERLYRYPR